MLERSLWISAICVCILGLIALLVIGSSPRKIRTVDIFKYLLWLALSSACILGVVSVVCLEYDYQTKTPTAVKQQHEQIAVELGKLSRGDLIELTDGNVVLVVVPTKETTSEICIRHHAGEEHVQFTPPSILARSVKSIARVDNADWCRLAKKFLADK